MKATRASLEDVVSALGVREPPHRIWQQPFDYDPSHLRKLCLLDGSLPAGADVVTYAHDLRYEELQPDLLRFLLPVCLQAWRSYLFATGSSPYGGFVEHFSPALAARSDLLDILEKFMSDSILDRMDEETALHFAGMGASPYKWFYALGSFAVIFAGLEPLWTQWWRMETPGHAHAALQWASHLMYEDGQNPIFSPWTPLGGGGPPGLTETDGHIYDRGWRPENITFLQATLSVEYFHIRLLRALQVLGDDPSGVPQKMASDFDLQKTLLALRIQQLPAMLAQPPMMGLPEWII